MDVDTHCTVITEHLPVLRRLGSSVLALPIEFLIREKMVGILMVGVHIVLGKGDEQKDMRWADDEPDIPDGWVEW